MIVSDSSKLNAYHYISVETRDDSYNLITATINITNSTGEVIFPTSYINGKTGWIKCLGYIQTGFGYDTSMNPYWITADNGSKKLKLGFDMSEGSKICVVNFHYYPPPT